MSDVYDLMNSLEEKWKKLFREQIVQQYSAL